MVRLTQDQLALIDRWIVGGGEPMSRPEAIRRLTILALQREGIG